MTNCFKSPSGGPSSKVYNSVITAVAFHGPWQIPNLSNLSRCSFQEWFTLAEQCPLSRRSVGNQIGAYTQRAHAHAHTRTHTHTHNALTPSPAPGHMHGGYYAVRGKVLTLTFNTRNKCKTRACKAQFIRVLATSSGIIMR